MIQSNPMIRREFQLEVWTLIIQKSTVIPLSPMVLLSLEKLCYVYRGRQCTADAFPFVLFCLPLKAWLAITPPGHWPADSLSHNVQLISEEEEEKFISLNA